ncbi:hypothetical protein Syun_026381 [Stephania yunnanensis]|uniref:Uncharacterized protein n=1 Tax=Stephania yunnanensis TaxID=152371 RepID=A0AAP0ETD5_9MAGN
MPWPSAICGCAAPSAVLCSSSSLSWNALRSLLPRLSTARVHRSSSHLLRVSAASDCAALAAVRRTSSLSWNDLRRCLETIAIALCRRCLYSPRRSSSLPWKLSPLVGPSTAAAYEPLPLVAALRHCLGNHRRWLGPLPPLPVRPPPLSPLFVVVRRCQTKLQRRRQELTQTTPDQPVDDEAMYYKVAGECPKGRVYGLGSLGRKKRIYVDADASTSLDLASKPNRSGSANWTRFGLAWVKLHLLPPATSFN